MILIDFRDIVWNYIGKKSIIYKLLSHALSLSVRFILNKVDYISVTNEFEKDLIRRISKKKCVILKNGISRKKFDQISEKSEFKEINLARPTISYIGNIGIAQNLSTLVDFARINKNYNIRISGHGAEYKKILELSKDCNNIKILGHIEWQEVLDEYSKADILYAQIKEDFSSALPTKPFEYLSSKRPIILGLPNGIAKDTYSKFQNIFICKPDNLESLTQAISEVINSSSEGYLKNEKRIIRNFIREDNILKFKNMFV
jgi:hypothetical protein